MKELIAEAERAVQSLQAFGWRKRRVREELVAHLSMIYDDERQRTGSDEAALVATFARWGDAGEIARELQTTVPTLERIASAPLPCLSAVDDLLWRKGEGESTTRFAARFASYMTVLVAGLGGLPVLAWSTVAAASRPHPFVGWVDPVVRIAAVFVALAAASFVNAALLDRTGLRARLAPSSHSSIATKGAIVGAFVVTFTVSFVGAFGALLFALPGSHGQALRGLLRIPPPVSGWILAVAVLLVFGLSQAILRMLDRRSRASCVD